MIVSLTKICAQYEQIVDWNIKSKNVAHNFKAMLQNKLSVILATVPTTAAVPNAPEKGNDHVNTAPPSVVLYTSIVPYPVPPAQSIA